MNELGTAAEHGLVGRMVARMQLRPADPRRRFKHDGVESGALQMPGCGQPGDAGAEDANVARLDHGAILSGQIPSLHRIPRKATWAKSLKLTVLNIEDCHELEMRHRRVTQRGEINPF